MSDTVQNLMKGMAMHLNGDTTVPDTDSDEYNLWMEALGQAQNEWGDSDYDFEELRPKYRTTCLQSQTSMALPDGFIKLNGFPKFGGIEYEEVKDQETGRYGSDERYVTVDLNDKSIRIHPALPSIASVEMPYQTRPTSLATLTSTSLCPSNNYLIFKACEHILFGRENERYAKFRDDAELAFNRMIGSQVHKREQMDTSVKNTTAVKNNFILGRD